MNRPSTAFTAPILGQLNTVFSSNAKLDYLANGGTEEILGIRPMPYNLVSRITPDAVEANNTLRWAREIRQGTLAFWGLGDWVIWEAKVCTHQGTDGLDAVFVSIDEAEASGSSSGVSFGIKCS